MRVGLYSPYLDTVGGGERYILTIAQALDEQVDFFIGTHLYSQDINKIKERINKLLNIDLTKINFIKAPFGPGSSSLKRAIFLKKYDCVFYLTDGSIFFSTAKKNIIHFQVPFNKGYSFWDKLKLSSWSLALYNSYFTKNLVEKRLSLSGEVIYPPVDTKKFKSLKKKNQIISVGRFFSYLKDKKHELLIEVFKELNLAGWSLQLAGSANEGDRDYLSELKFKAEGSAVEFYPNISFEDLKRLYGESKIYWHASGFGETDPKKFEHFGISTVEAMAAGCVPVVINKGGQKEIVDEESGYLWDSLDELKKYTLTLVENPETIKKMSRESVNKSERFDQSIFCKKIREIVYG